MYPSVASVDDEIKQRTRFKTLFAWSADGWVARHLSTWCWPGVVECLSFMLIGIALFRSGFLTAEAPTRAYIAVCLLGYAIGLSVRFAALAWIARTGFEVAPDRIIPAVSVVRSFLYEPARLCITVAHLSLITLLFRFKALGKANALRDLGRMSLTIYTLQSAITAIVFYGFRAFGRFDFAQLMLASIAIWIVTAMFVKAWLRSFRMGPAEWMIRAVAYGRFRPLSDEKSRLSEI